MTEPNQQPLDEQQGADASPGNPGAAEASKLRKMTSFLAAKVLHPKQTAERLKALPGYDQQQHFERGGEVQQAGAEHSDAFKNWFGDWEAPTPKKTIMRSLVEFAASQFTARHKRSHASVVVDEHGKPKPVYHGTMAQFDAFDNAKTNANSLFGPGHYFTEDQSVAEGYTSGNALREFRADEDRSSPRLIKAYLNIRNPFDADAYLQRMAAAPGAAKFSYDFISDAMRGNKSATEKLRKLGYDGITHTGGEITKGKKHKVWIAFEPNQIKSTDNEGTFNPSDPRMHKKGGGEVPQVPGIPRDADEVPIRAQAGEVVIRNGPAQLWRSQLDAMNRGETPHFAAGGMVLAAGARGLATRGGTSSMATAGSRSVPALQGRTQINFPEPKADWADMFRRANDYVEQQPPEKDSPFSWAGQQDLQRKVYGTISVPPSPPKKRSLYPDMGQYAGLSDAAGLAQDVFGMFGGGMGGGGTPKKGGPGGGISDLLMPGRAGMGGRAALVASAFPQTAPFAGMIGGAVDQTFNGGGDESGDAKSELVKALRELIDVLKKKSDEGPSGGGIDPATGRFTPTLGGNRQQIIQGINYGAVARSAGRRP